MVEQIVILSRLLNIGLTIIEILNLADTNFAEMIVDSHAFRFSFNDFSKLFQVYITTYIVMRVKNTKLRGLYDKLGEFLYVLCVYIVKTHKRSYSLQIPLSPFLRLS